MSPTMTAARGAPPGPAEAEPAGDEPPGSEPLGEAAGADRWVVSGGVLIAEAAEAVVTENRARSVRWDAVSRFHAERVAESEAAVAAARAAKNGGEGRGAGLGSAGRGWFGLTPLQATVAEFAPLFAVSELSVQITLDVVDGVKRWFPGVWGRCLAGRMDLGRAQLCWEQLSNLTCEADRAAYAGLVEEWVARHDDPGEALCSVDRERLRRAVRRLCLKFPQYDPQAQFAAAFKKRGVRLRTEENGIAHLSGSMAVHDGMSADYRLTLIAKRLAQEPGETRTLEQLRADTLVDLVLGRLTVTASAGDLEDEDGTDHDHDDHDHDHDHDHGEGCGGADSSTGTGSSGTDAGTDHDHSGTDASDGIDEATRGSGWCRRVSNVGAFARPVVNVTVSIGTLLGFSDEPGTMAGGVAVPAELARLIANRPDSTWYRMLTDDAGGFVELSTDSYAPTAPIERWTVARDQTCRWPGCHRSASVCECDHRVPHPVGATCTDNLHCLCRRHHRFKHSQGVAVARHGDGSSTWTTRFGSTFHTPAPEYPTGTLDGAS